MILTDELLEIFNRTFGNGYMKLQKVALIDEFYGYHLGLIIFAANLKLLKILAFVAHMISLISKLSSHFGDSKKQKQKNRVWAFGIWISFALYSKKVS